MKAIASLLKSPLFLILLVISLAGVNAIWSLQQQKSAPRHLSANANSRHLAEHSLQIPVSTASVVESEAPSPSSVMDNQLMAQASSSPALASPVVIKQPKPRVTQAPSEGPLTLPLAFQELDPSSAPTPEEQAVLERIQASFLQAIGVPPPDPTTTPAANAAANAAAQQQALNAALNSTDPQRRQIIVNAQVLADEQFCAIFGQEAFLKFQEARGPPS